MLYSKSCNGDLGAKEEYFKGYAIARAMLRGLIDSLKGTLIIFYLDKNIKERAQNVSPNKESSSSRRKDMLHKDSSSKLSQRHEPSTAEDGEIEDIADSAYRYSRGRPQLLSSVSKLIADTLFSILVQALFLVQGLVVSMLPIVVLSDLLSLLHMCMLYSLYAFEYKWFNMGWELHRRLTFIENNWPYFFGFGLPLAVLTSLPSSYIISGCVFSILFPLFIISGNEAEPVTGVCDFPLQLFTPVIAISNMLFNRTIGPKSASKRSVTLGYLRPLALTSASLKSILWDGGREGERRGVAPQPTEVFVRANKKRWITETVDGASYRTGLVEKSAVSPPSASAPSLSPSASAPSLPLRPQRPLSHPPRPQRRLSLLASVLSLSRGLCIVSLPGLSTLSLRPQRYLFSLGLNLDSLPQASTLYFFLGPQCRLSQASVLYFFPGPQCRLSQALALSFFLGPQCRLSQALAL
uniref:Etoposide-induced protein 2.4 n=1 Tax=Timema douglasi TaxID=61478 RepID=A0A7R8VQP5_TIMDO|nr:unnamed protein product [Timema douglasi]